MLPLKQPMPPLSEPQRQAIRDFLRWLDDIAGYYEICERTAGYEYNEWEPARKSVDDWLAAFADYRADPHQRPLATAV